MKRRMRLATIFLMIVSLFVGCKTTKTEVQEKTKPTDDGVLNVLMIGNSFCYYYTDELYDMLASAGIDAVIANVYYSGCSVQSHAAWLKNDSANYEFTTVSEEGRNSQKNCSLKWCLNEREWDIISLQQHFNPETASNVEVATKTCVPYAESIYNYLKKNHPDARLLWQQTWAYQVGYEGPVNKDPQEVKESQKVLTIEKQTLCYENIHDVSLLVCEKCAVERIPSGDAWQIARANPMVGDILCNKNNTDTGDNYHDGDSGGGQFLNACVWYEIITGESCLENEYIPTYLTNMDKVSALREAAHQAVNEMKEGN